MKKTNTIKLAILLFLLMPQLSWADQTINIKAVLLSELAFYPEYSAPATAVSLNESVLSAELKARILRFTAQVGERLKKGASLVLLDCRDYKLAFEQVQAGIVGIQARYDFSVQRLRRVKRLRDQKNIDEELLEQAQMELAGLQAELSVQEIGARVAENNVSKCTVRAPFDAIVVNRLSSTGALAISGTPLIKVVDVNKESLEVSAQVMIQQVVLLQQATQIVFSSNEQLFPLKLRSVTGMVDPLLRSREARFTFVEKQPLPGQSGRLIWKGTQVVIPADYLLDRNGRLGLFIAENGVAKFHETPGALEGRPLRVDLPGNAWVITEGRFSLKDGDHISRVQ